MKRAKKEEEEFEEYTSLFVSLSSLISSHFLRIKNLSTSTLTNKTGIFLRNILQITPRVIFESSLESSSKSSEYNNENYNEESKKKEEEYEEYTSFSVRLSSLVSSHFLRIKNLSTATSTNKTIILLRNILQITPRIIFESSFKSSEYSNENYNEESKKRRRIIRGIYLLLRSLIFIDKQSLSPYQESLHFPFNE